MKREGINIVLEKADAVRMNQLVRKRIDYSRFSEWYGSLESEEQAALIGGLCHFAYQAGVDEVVYAAASKESGLDQSDPSVVLMKRVKGPGGLNFGGLAKWLESAEPEVREMAFRWFVYLFGVAERRFRQTERPESCNHWWHRDLDDPRVVESILKDPEYYRTSPRDDEKLSNEPMENR